MQTQAKVLPLISTGYAFLGDVHEEEDHLKEITSIIEEVCEISLSYGVSHFFQLGDLCQKNRLEALELYYLLGHISKCKKTFKLVSLIEGNHDKKDNEISIISFLKWLGIKVYSDEYLLETPFGNLFLGHFFVDKSKDAFGTHHKYTVENLKNKYSFKYGLLGHQHDYQQIDNIYHIGSARYVSFGENGNIKKKMAIWNKDGLKFIDLKSPIPIFNVSTIKELEKIPSRSKVRFIFKSFSSFKDDLKKVESFKGKFVDLKKKLDFSSISPYSDDLSTKLKKIEGSGKINNKLMVEEWLKQIPDTELRKILDEEFKKELLK